MPSLGITVNTASDVADAETLTIVGLEQDPGPDGVVSLREALLAAHGVAQPGSPVQIVLNNSEADLRILIGTELPSISVSNVEIVGNGAVLDGSTCDNCFGVEISGARNTIDSLTIVGFTRSAIRIHGPNAIENVVTNCNLGILDDLPFPNGSGIWIQDYSSHNLIRDSVISGNKFDGIAVLGPKTNGNRFYGNFVGVTRDGQTAITNGFELIGGGSSSFGFVIRDSIDTEIGRGPDSGNIISAYHSRAISIAGEQTVGVKIRANRIELQPNVIARVPDLYVGEAISVSRGASFIEIGGPDTGDGNYISTFQFLPSVYVGAYSPGNPPVTNVRIMHNEFTNAFSFTELPAAGLVFAEHAANCVVGPGNKIHGFDYGIDVRNGAERIESYGNSIFDNRVTGIRVNPLANGGVQPPVISAGEPYTGQTVPCGLVDFYADEGGQGRLYLGAQYADADGSFALRAPGDVPEGLNITTIVTDRYGNSSAFSAPVPVAQLPRGPLEAAPALGPCARFYYHAADPSRDYAIDLSELLRGIQLYNALAYHCDAAAEDGYAPGAGDQGCAVHTLDYNPQDWRISMSELLRAIQFYNTPGGYAPCDTGEDGFCPATAG
jgi:hypothetical protein